MIAQLFMLEWDWYRFDKKHTTRRYTELVFLHPVESAGHVLHSDASAERNMIALFFMLGLDWYRFDKKRVRTHYAELVFCIRWDMRVM
jgi:hypothetical protein